MTWKALAASFVVYLLPLAGPHAVWVFGMSLAAELTGIGQRREPAWVGVDAALALAMQAAAFGLFRWFFSRRGWARAGVLLAAVPVFLGVLHWLYLVRIPVYFLIDPDHAPEQGEWAVECVVPDAWLDASVRTPADMSLERAGEAVFYLTNGFQKRILQLPGCRQVVLNFDSHNAHNFYVVPGGRMIYQTGKDWWYVAGTGAAPRRIETPAGASESDGPAILSNDGRWMAWVLREPRGVFLRSLGDGREIVLRLPLMVRSSTVLLGLDMTARKLALARNAEEIHEAGLDGSVERVVMDWGDLRPGFNTIRRWSGGWVAWDVYGEQEPYRIAWSAAGSRGVHRVLKGRTIHSASADPEGRLIALSAGSALSIGDVRDAIYVLRASDGVEVYRRYLPRYTRTHVAFLGTEFLVYSHYDGRRSEVRVLRAPAL